MEFLLIAIIVFLSCTLIWQIADLFRIKDNQIAELQHALVEAYTEIELIRLGVSK